MTGRCSTRASITRAGGAVVRRAFELAAVAPRKLTSVDKANVLETSRMWRRVATTWRPSYPDVAFEHMLVDNAAMQLVQAPERFDVIVTENMFGDILSDVAAAVTGGLGLAGSASLGWGRPRDLRAGPRLGPGHRRARGSRTRRECCARRPSCSAFGLGRPDEARRLDDAVERALAKAPTPDLGGAATTVEFGDAVLEALGNRA